MGQLVLAYHGCDISTRDALIRGDINCLNQSNNKYDWLGKGIYMFLDDPERALKLATYAAQNPDKILTKRPIVEPSVVGCILDVDRWLDLSTENGRKHFQTGVTSLKEAAEVAKELNPNYESPVNKPAFEGDQDILHRAYDCAVVNMIHEVRNVAHIKAIESGIMKKIHDTMPFQATRSIFEQGESVESSRIYDGSHTQISVRDDECIKGWFLLRGEKLQSEVKYKQSKEFIAQAIEKQTSKKVRVRATG